MPLIPPSSAAGSARRALMTDVIELLDVAATVTGLNETVYDMDNATVTASGMGSFQTFFSAEYDVDRDTYNMMGRVITDDPGLQPSPKTFIRVNGGEIMEVDGFPQIWTLRGQHHIEFNVKRMVG